jgi:hypothetical protein
VSSSPTSSSRGLAAALRSESGQALPLLALGLLTVVLGFAALVLDVGRAYLVQRQLQSVADAVALTASDSLPDAASATATAAQFGPASKNRVRGVAVTQTVTPWCLASLTYCYGNAPGRAPGNGKANGVVVTEAASVPTTFARIFGIDAIPVRAKATACGMCAVQPLDIALVLDRTGSMADDVQNLSNGVRAFLQSLDPALDYVTLLETPPIRSSACRAGGGLAFPFDRSSYDAYSYAGSNYTVVRMSHDYKRADGSLNESSDLVEAVDPDCLTAGGGTAYKEALMAAQDELVRHGSGRPNVQRVIVFESDGAANAAPESWYSSSTGASAEVTSQYVSRDWRGNTYDVRRTETQTIYRPASGHTTDVQRPCGSAVSYASSIKPDTLIATVAYAVNRDDDCYASPHYTKWTTKFGKVIPTDAVGYRDPDAHEPGMSAGGALAAIATQEPGWAVSQANPGDMSAIFRQIATKLINARLVPDSEAD